MKRCMIALILCLTLLLCGCTAEKAPKMYVEPAQLTKQEDAIVKLLGADPDQFIYDFTVDQTVKSFQLNVYCLEDGQWVPSNGGGGYAWDNPKGRLALGFGVIPNGMRVALQCGDDYSATRHTSAEPMDTTGMSRGISRLSSRTALTYDQEVPLVIQSFTDRMEHYSYTPESYFTPEVFADKGFTHVYAITIQFSQNPLE